MIAAIIQARMGSTRLPGKVLEKLAGRTVLEHIIRRVQCSRHIQTAVVATTAKPEDHPILDLCRELNVSAFTGSEQDVLDRFYQAAVAVGATVIVRVTADDPLKDPRVIDHVIEQYLALQCDYASNTMEPTYPEGLDIEVFSFSALERAWKEAQLPSEHEHVTPYIWKHGDRFKLCSVKQAVDQSSLRWTLDTPQDLEFFKAIYSRLYRGEIFYMEDVLSALEREPELSQINQGQIRNAGYLKSLQAEGQGDQG